MTDGVTNAYGARLANNFTGQSSPGDAFPTTLELRLGIIVSAEDGTFTELTTTGYSAVTIDVTSPGLTFGPPSTAGTIGLTSTLTFGVNSSGSDVDEADFTGCAIWDTTADEALHTGLILNAFGDWLAGYTLYMDALAFNWNAN